MSVFAARMTPRSSDWLALGDGRYGNELRQQQQPMPTAPCQRHVRPATFGETDYTAVTVKPDPDNAFQHVAGLPHVNEFYRTGSQACDRRGNWMSSSPSFDEDSRHQTSGHGDTSTSWPVARQRFPDARATAVARALDENYTAPRPLPDEEGFSQRRGGSPAEDSGHEPWGVDDDRSCQSPHALPPTSTNNDPYRTAPGHHQPAEFGAYRPGADEGDDDQGGLYRPRKLLADFYRHRQRQDVYQRQQRQESAVERDDDRLMGETGRWVKAVSAYDGSPPVEPQSSEATNYLNGRRQTWPFGTSVVPVVRRRQLQQTSDQYVNYVEEDVDRPTVPRQSTACTAAASPMSRLIQRYDHHTAVTSSASDAFPVVASEHQTPPSGRGDWFSLPWQPPITSAAMVDNNSSSSTENSLTISEHGEGIKTYSCHICSYIGESKMEFDAHMRLHFDHRCPFCDYSSRTEGRLRCHIKTFHADGGLCSAAPTTDQAAKRKPKIITCQKCGFKAKEKEELWIHRRQQHMSADKVLECPRCPFATELRHHLEYHLRSHYGSRPYKCDKCTYRCYNQSMLNSHAKSHTNVYQFRCADCQFAAKYCHSLKVHLRQNPMHTAAPVLNEDGSVPTDGSGDFEVISRRGRPRGPRAPRHMPRSRISRQAIAPMPLPRALSLSVTSSADPGSSVQYSEHVMGPPPVTSGFPANDETRRIDSGMFPLLAPAYGADFAVNQRNRHASPFQTNSSSAFQLRTVNTGPRDDRTAAFSSSPSLYLPVHMDVLERTMTDDHEDRRCRSYSPSTFEQQLVLPVAASSQSQGSVLAPATAYGDHGVDVVVSPQMPEPEPALCGDLPLDLTARSRPDDARSPFVIEPEASSWSPDDVTVYRPRRHYETWKQGSRPRSSEPATCERKDSEASTGSDVNPEVGIAHVQPEPQIVVESASDGETTDTAAPPAKRCRLSTDVEEPVTEVASGSPAGGTDGVVVVGRYQCSHCEIEFFGSRVLHAMHMAFHGPVDPFQCSQCGVRTADRVEFFLHLARAAHS